MKERLNFRQTMIVASMLFGLFFGAGNLIFPVHMGQLAGSNVWQAVLGFIITGVGIPILGVAALGITHSSGLLDLSSRIGKGYGIFFTLLLYLTIGPFFAIPRCATVPFSMGVAPLVGQEHTGLALFLFTVAFFGIVLFFSLRPAGILTWVGKILTPVFLVCLAVLVVAAFLHPIGGISSATPVQAYESGAVMKGFLEGYNTMDAIAGLAFGIIVVNAVRSLGIRQPGAVAVATVKSGLFSGLMMAAIYLAITPIGTQSRGLFAVSENGSIALAEISGHYFGTAGTLLLAGISTFACLKTAIGLIISCAETFTTVFPKGPKYKTWVLIFCAVSFGLANIGLTSIINYSVPVLMFLYPLAITLILLALCGKLFDHDRIVYLCVTLCTLFAALFDFMNALPATIIAALHLQPVIDLAAGVLPLFSVGLGWVVPAVAGLILGLVLRLFRRKKAKKTAAA